jgi:hypothetical protein
MEIYQNASNNNVILMIIMMVLLKPMCLKYTMFSTAHGMSHRVKVTETGVYNCQCFIE